jgi:hypothetical protein
MVAVVVGLTGLVASPLPASAVPSWSVFGNPNPPAPPAAG